MPWAGFFLTSFCGEYIGVGFSCGVQLWRFGGFGDWLVQVGLWGFGCAGWVVDCGGP